MKNLNLISFVYLLLAPILCLTSSTVIAQESIFDISITSPLSYDDEFLKSDQAFNVSFDQQGNKLKVSFEIAPDYYLYRHQFKFQSNKLTLSPIGLPLGITHQDDFFGVQQVYKERLSLILDIEHASADASIKVTYQGCAAKGLCYPPTTKTVIINEVRVNDTSVNIKEDKR